MQRERIAAEWLARYGEPIDCFDLTHAARLSKAASSRRLQAYEEREREVLAIALSFEARVEALLAAERERLVAVLAERVPGRSDSVSGLHDAHVEACRDEGRDEPGLPFPLVPFDLTATAVREKVRRGFVATVRDQPGFGTAKAQRRGADLAFGEAASKVAAWIRARHRSRAGDLDGRVSWGDVALCLEYHGHAPWSVSACREAARRFEQGQEEFPSKGERADCA